MPAGNDTAYHETFREALEAQGFGEFQNAEELIRAHQQSQDPALNRALMTQVDLGATELLNEDLDAAAKKFEGVPKGWTLEAATVRGNAIVGAFLDPESGTYVKLVTGANERFAEEEARRETGRAARGKAEAARKKPTARRKPAAKKA